VACDIIGPHMTILDHLVLGWFGLTSLLAFLLFGCDKFQAGRSGRRVPERHLVLLGAIGGWLGGLLGMLVFRHKTAKGRFWLKYAGGFLPFAGLAYFCLARVLDRAN
jgi:uncharacterized membrane protein YsdA (DUF1294 family)